MDNKLFYILVGVLCLIVIVVFYVMYQYSVQTQAQKAIDDQNAQIAALRKLQAL